MKNVLLIDSGSGGVSVLKECVQVAHCCNYLLFCDTKNLPYGNKTKDELEKITIENLKKIQSFFKFDIVILACNTLTSTCLNKCRETFPKVIFIGTVPAIKPALEKFKAEEVLVLATPTTIQNNELIRHNQNLILKPMPNLAEQIDKNLDNIDNLLPELKEKLQGIKPKAVVLGCTHYSAIKPLLFSILGDIKIFDSANGVARRLKSFINDDSTNFQVQIMVSGDENFVSNLWWFFNN